MSLSVTLTLLVLTMSLACEGQTFESFKCTHTLSLFPQGCSCSSPPNSVEPILDCSNLSLSSVPRPTEPMSYVLFEFKLNNNSITSLPDRAFRDIKVLSLDLRDNAISTVSDTAFADMPTSLHTLHLQGDTQNLPPKPAFTHLGNLRTLTLVDYDMPVIYADHSVEPTLVFISLVKLERLTLQRCKLRVLEHTAFFQPSGPLNLKELSLLDQDFRSAVQEGVREVPSLVKLTISGNPNLAKLTPFAFNSLNSLETLDLSGNGINEIEDEAFAGLANVKTLVLVNNIFQPNTIGSFSGLIGLETLDMSYNDLLTSVPTFQGLDTRQKLAVDLSHCPINSLETNALHGLADYLDSLNLSYNRISSPSDAVFETTTQLRTLKLAHQDFSGPSLRVPSSLGRIPLVHLDLSGHPVDTNSLWPVVRNLSTLEVLRLSSTDLTSIPDMALQELRRLKELDLNFAGLNQLKQESLVGPRYTLEKLFLNGNLFQTLPHCLLHQYELSKALEMSLDRNSLLCDCDLSWIPEYTNRNFIFFNEEPTCPDGVSLLAKSPQDLGCVSGATTSLCPNHYQGESSTQKPDPTPRPQLSLRLDEIGQNKLIITWAIQPSTDLKFFRMEMFDNVGDNVIPPEQFDKDTDRFITSELETNKLFTVCVTPVYTTPGKTECKTYRITGTGTDPPEALTDDDDDDTNIGIIIGAVVAGVVLLVLLAAIAYLVFIRRKPKPPPKSSSGNRHVQPRTYTKSELPDMAKDSMQVVAISDGMTQNGSRPGSVSSDGTARVGRAYMLTSEGSTYKDMSDLRAPSSTYENDRGPLPKAPRNERGPQPTLAAPHCYYNQGFSKYDEIGPREVTL